MTRNARGIAIEDAKRDDYFTTFTEREYDSQGRLTQRNTYTKSNDAPNDGHPDITREKKFETFDTKGQMTAFRFESVEISNHERRDILQIQRFDQGTLVSDHRTNYTVSDDKSAVRDEIARERNTDGTYTQVESHRILKDGKYIVADEQRATLTASDDILNGVRQSNTPGVGYEVRTYADGKWVLSPGEQPAPPLTDGAQPFADSKASHAAFLQFASLIESAGDASPHADSLASPSFARPGKAGTRDILS